MIGPIIRDIERLSGLENQYEEVESLFVCEVAPECGDGEGVMKHA